MGKYSAVRKQSKKPEGIHPLIRGIGCIMMIIVPILSYGLSVMVVGYGGAHGWPIPREWYGAPSVHPLLWKLSGLQPILRFYQAQNNLEAFLAFTIPVMITIGGILIIVYGYIYRLFGPSQYGPQDAPPIRKKVKAYKR